MSLSRRRLPRRGLLTLEWVLIVTVLVIGIIGGLGLVRNAVVEEMVVLAQSILNLQVDPDAPEPTPPALQSNHPAGFDDSGPETILAPDDPQLD